MVIIDTNCLLRFFLHDNKKQSNKVRKLLEAEETIYLPESVLPEIEYVMKKVYRQNKTTILDAFHYLVEQKNISMSKEMQYAIQVYQNYNIDFVDCLAAAHSLGNKLASFDKKLLKVDNITPYWEK